MNRNHTNQTRKTTNKRVEKETNSEELDHIRVCFPPSETDGQSRAPVEAFEHVLFNFLFFYHFVTRLMAPLFRLLRLQLKLNFNQLN